MIAGYAADALASLTPSQVQFLQELPKAELHAHLNGCIPIAVLQDLALEQLSSTNSDLVFPDAVREGVQRLQQGVTLNEIHDFFGLFPAIYTLTSTPSSLARAARAVLELFLEPLDGYVQAVYLELRSTPRETSSMTRLQYLETILDEIEKYSPDQAALVVSLDRRMADDVARECIDCAVQLRKAGRRVVGVDLCGDPLAGDMGMFAEHFRAARAAGLGITVHIAETIDNPAPEALQLLSFEPTRLGHATFLDEAAKEIVRKNRTAIEICLSSNLLCKTVSMLDDHHITYYLKHDHPVVICTDDTLPFRNSLLSEYALLMAAPPLGLGLSEDEIKQVARTGMESRFRM